jgi:hypothetical protein
MSIYERPTYQKLESENVIKGSLVLLDKLDEKGPLVGLYDKMGYNDGRIRDQYISVFSSIRLGLPLNFCEVECITPTFLSSGPAVTCPFFFSEIEKLAIGKEDVLTLLPEIRDGEYRSYVDWVTSLKSI